jgi:flagellar protein FliS
MSHNGHDTYLEGRVLSADPLELVRLLYHGCSDAVREARRRLADGDIAGRSAAISKAYDILAELANSLDLARGGEIGHRLAGLYDYMMRRLVEANLEQKDASLAEVLGLLATLTEAWDGVNPQTAEPTPVRDAWAPPIPGAEPSMARAWSF